MKILSDAKAIILKFINDEKQKCIDPNTNAPRSNNWATFKNISLFTPREYGGEKEHNKLLEFENFVSNTTFSNTSNFIKECITRLKQNPIKFVQNFYEKLYDIAEITTHDIDFIARRWSPGMHVNEASDPHELESQVEAIQILNKRMSEGEIGKYLELIRRDSTTFEEQTITQEVGIELHELPSYQN